MENETFNAEMRKLLREMLKERNIVINHFEEQHDLYSDTYNISITCLYKEEEIKENENE